MIYRHKNINSPLWLVLLVLHCPLLQAQTDQHLEPGPDDQRPWLYTSFNWLEEQHDYLANRVTTSATVIDQYVSRDAFDTSISNESYVRINMKQKFSAGDDEGFDLKVKAKLDVPNTKRSTKLIFNSDSRDSDSLSERQRDVSTASGTSRADRNDAEAGLLFEGKQRKSWTPNLSIGLKLNIPMDPYIKVGFTRFDELPALWQSRFRQKFYFYRVDGAGSDSQFDIYRPIGSNKILLSVSEAQYQEKDDVWEVSQALSLYQRLNSKNAIEYQIGGIATNEPHFRPETGWLKFEWRRLIYKDWLFTKLTPELVFPRERDFDVTPGILFELEIYFSENMLDHM